MHSRAPQLALLFLGIACLGGLFPAWSQELEEDGPSSAASSPRRIRSAQELLLERFRQTRTIFRNQMGRFKILVQESRESYRAKRRRGRHRLSPSSDAATPRSQPTAEAAAQGGSQPRLGLYTPGRSATTDFPAPSLEGAVPPGTLTPRR